MVRVNKYQQDTDALQGRRVTVLGAGRSGVAAAELLQHTGALVFVSDHSENALSEEHRKRLQEAGVAFETGQHSRRVYQADLAVISPGIPDTAPVVRELEHREIPVISEIELSSWFVQETVIAITGSNGKTTTSTLVSELLEFGEHDPVLCGNIGRPFAQAVMSRMESKKKGSTWWK